MSDEQKRGTVFLIGSGVARNSWKPIVRAVKSLDLGGDCSPHLLADDDMEGANSLMVHIVNMRRHLKIVSMDTEQPRQKLALFKQAEAKYLARHNALKASLMANLKAAADSGEIELRGRFKELVLASESPRKLFTTNWDDLLYRFRDTVGLDDSDTIVHLHHGGRGPSLELMLPGETIYEPYRPQKHRKALADHILTRTKDITNARRVVIYGHSLAPTEAELRALLAWGLMDGHGEILVVNVPGEIERVVQRLQPLLPPAGHGDWSISTEEVPPDP